MADAELIRLYPSKGNRYSMNGNPQIEKQQCSMIGKFPAKNKENQIKEGGKKIDKCDNTDYICIVQNHLLQTQFS